MRFLKARMKKNLLLILLLSFMLIACSKAVNIELSPQVTVFISEGSDETVQLTKADPAYSALNDWLKNNQEGWYSTSGKYSGGVYLVSGERGIQVTELKVIIYTNVADRPQAIYVKEITREELADLKKLGF